LGSARAPAVSAGAGGPAVPPPVPRRPVPRRVLRRNRVLRLPPAHRVRHAGAVRAAVEVAVHVHAVPDDAALAVLADRRHPGDRALERVERVHLALRVDLERQVVLVAADLAGRHRCVSVPPPRRDVRPSRPCPGQPTPHSRRGRAVRRSYPVRMTAHTAPKPRAPTVVRPSDHEGEAMTVTARAPRRDERGRPRKGRRIDDWRPEDPEFWAAGGARVARRNLVFSIFAEHIGFSVWSLWSVLV